MISIQGLMDDAVQDGCFFMFLVVLESMWQVIESYPKYTRIYSHDSKPCVQEVQLYQHPYFHIQHSSMLMGRTLRCPRSNTFSLM